MPHPLPDGFDWDPEKYRINLVAHKLSFRDAARALDDPDAVEWIDGREDYGKERIIALYRLGVRLLYVVYTERGNRRRIISAARRRDIRQNFIKLDKASRTPSATQTDTDRDAFDAMTDEEVTDAAKAAPDCPPLTDDTLKHLRRRPRRH